MDESAIIVTGATGFVGRHLVEALAPDRTVWALARGSPLTRGTTLPPGVRWIPVDIADSGGVRAAFERVRRHGGADIVIHLAGHYDFTGERNPEYESTNVVGMRNVLDAARDLGIADFVFASSIAACGFPPPGASLTETSSADGDTPYAESKRIGERMLAEYRDAFRCWTVRFAAMFSDWCEYEPLYRFVEIWLSRHPRSRVLAGAGESAIPFLHVRDGIAFLRAVLDRRRDLDPGAVLLASTDGATSHRELFETVTASQFGQRATPVFVSAPLCRLGLRVRETVGEVIGTHVFERPWMGRYIDLAMTVDAAATRERLGWRPRARLAVLRRVPFMIQNRKSAPSEWQRRNHADLRSVRRHENLRIHALLEGRIPSLVDAHVGYLTDPVRDRRFPKSRDLPPDRLVGESEFLLRALVDAVRTGEKAIFRTACREIALQRARSGSSLDETASAVDALGDLATLALATIDPSREWSLALYDHVTMTVQFGIDEVHEALEASR